MVEFVAGTFDRHKVVEHGATPCKSIRGRDANVPVAEFREWLMYHGTKKIARERSKVESIWEHRGYLGNLFDEQWVQHRNHVWRPERSFHKEVAG